MSRDKFGALAASLSDADLARVLAAIGAFYPDRYVGQSIDSLARTPGSGFAWRGTAARPPLLTFPVRLRALQDYLANSAGLSALADPAGDAVFWLDRWSEMLTKSPPLLRIQVDARDFRYEPQLAIDPDWLMRLLARRELACAGIFLALSPEHVRLSWNWPLRIGVVEVPGSKEFAEVIAGGRYRQLYELIDLAAPQARCDLLLLPADIAPSMNGAFALPAAGASAIVVTGGLDKAPPQTQWWLDALRRMMKAGALGLAFVPPDERALWFQTLIAEIAHNATLDVALYAASLGSERNHHRSEFPELSTPRQDLRPPALAAYPEFLELAHMTGLARRVGEAMAAMSTSATLSPLERSFSGMELPAGLPLPVVGQQLAIAAEQLAFHQETASVLARLQEQIEATGSSLALPPIEVGIGAPEIAPPPPVPVDIAQRASTNTRMMSSRPVAAAPAESDRDGFAPGPVPYRPEPPQPTTGGRTAGPARASSQARPPAPEPPLLPPGTPDGAAPSAGDDRRMGAPASAPAPAAPARGAFRPSAAARDAEAPPRTMGATPSPWSDIATHFRRWLGRGKAWRDRMASGSTPASAAADDVAAASDSRESIATGARAQQPYASPAPTRATPPRERPPRFVQLDLFGRTPSTESARIDPVIDPGVTYTIALHIGELPFEREQIVVGGQPVDERLLPPSREGHTLSIAFTPLWTSEEGAPAVGQVLPVFLPRTGASTRAAFEFTAPADLARFRARVVVLYENRVLQSLLLDRARAVGAAADAPAKLRLTVENALVRDFGVDTHAPQFAAALIVNDNPQGATGLTAIVGNTAAFVEPEGLKSMVGDIRKELAKLNVPEGTDEDEVVYGLDDARVQQMLYALAMRGAAIAKMLRRDEAMKPFLSARKIQVVDAAAGAYLPVELIYDGRAPAPGATRCPKAVAALGDLAIHRDCPHNSDDAYYCPAAFWGFSRCIERQPHGDNTGYRFAHPQPGANMLQPLRKSMLAASRKVRAVDLDLPSGLEAVLAQSTGAVVRAQSWKDWQDKIRAERPSLLILLPHSLESPTVANMPALEISGTSVEWARMDDAYVLAAPPQDPIVLVLGCSTALPDVAFLDFVREFKANGAALTIGTIATIRGRQTRDFVRELLSEMRLAADGEHTFDEVFLTVKQRLLAKGDPFVLSLLAYGDTGWRIAR